MRVPRAVWPSLLLVVLLAPVTSLAWPTLLPDTPDNGRPFALAADHSGDVFVAGRVAAPSGDDDGVRAKFAGSDGAVLWQQRTDGEAAAGGGGGGPTAEAL